ncbi:hypothetical protein H1224_06680 [Pectobacterium aroidearum]|uniref:hypothetical protein n=1 Tax=Pectobacterium aroidearum TaxID=1201031 RepID=UPI0015F71E0C|nr:hypothetical protein [Pectobacterium aroidearum]MBA5600748.1 hypothetical protein [Pectobacterium aroidearum]
MIWLIVYGISIILIAVVYCFMGWYKLTYNSLISQKLFLGAIFVPFLSFLYFGFFAWKGHSVDMSSEGLNTFIMISKLPLGLLSLSIPFVAIITSLHRSIQTATQISSTNTQIELIKRKNSLDELFSREKNFVDKCAYIEKQVGDIDIKLKNSVSTFKFNISAPHVLFHKIYNTIPNNGDITYELTSFVSGKFLVEFSTIEESLKLHYECMEKNKDIDIDDELSRLFVIVRALCRSFDLLSVPTCQIPCFYIKGKYSIFQICISTEEELKTWLRKYIIFLESLFSAVNLSGEYSLFNMKKYTFQGFNLFPSFSQGNIMYDHSGVNWDSTVNVFKNGA